MAVRALLIGITFWEIGMLYWLLCGTVLEKKYFRKKEWSILCGNIVVLGALLGVNRSLIFFSRLMLVICVIITCLCAVLIECQSKLLITIIIALYYISVTLVDFLFAFVSMQILKQKFDSKVYTYANSLTECIIFACSRILIAGCISMIVKKKYDEMYISEFKGMLLIITVILYSILRLYQVEMVSMINESREKEARIAGISLTGILSIIFFIGMLYSKNKALEREKQFLHMREAMATQRFREIEDALERDRVLSHDLKNHFIILKNYAKEGEYEKIFHYLEEVEQEFISNEVRMWTGNQIADMLIEQKRLLAEQYEITLDIQAVPIAKWPFDDNETCSLLGNLLDNAIEACRQIKKEERRIFLKIDIQKQLLFIETRNTIDEMPVIKNGRPVSTKRNKEEHGYGLKSVERIVNKYEGAITYLVKENIFLVNLSF